ncbi:MULTISPECIES: hypothetical protein [unclassified Thalassolituus]|jgi:hypothetical protein|uniref:hypothetical protein n=1 Tax=Oceanospirillaceae TaxID=135620 RepID=UPI00118EC9EE|nr:MULTISPECIES: hypothetical protein [unclassified Thalassolituus]TVV42106.1 hypothetical protein FOT50_16040 [Thalassolituus sp. C2-1]|tara:strand:- start:119 stop:676 length:558 start_codon:yes stop_codon:yes gene_type:complete
MRIVMTLLFSLLAPLAMAADLTEKDVKHWMEAMPALENWLDQHEDQLPEEDFSAGESSIDAMFNKGIEQLKAAGLYDDFSKQVKAGGYKNIEHWAEISRRVTMGYMALEMENEQVSLSQLEAQLEQIRQSEGMPAEQKMMMEQMMGASLMMMRAVENVSEQDKSAVRPFRQQLADQFAESGDDDE